MTSCGRFDWQLERQTNDIGVCFAIRPLMTGWRAGSITPNMMRSQDRHADGVLLTVNMVIFKGQLPHIFPYSLYILPNQQITGVPLLNWKLLLLEKLTIGTSKFGDNVGKRPKLTKSVGGSEAAELKLLKTMGPNLAILLRDSDLRCNCGPWLPISDSIRDGQLQECTANIPDAKSTSMAMSIV